MSERGLARSHPSLEASFLMHIVVRRKVAGSLSPSVLVTNSVQPPLNSDHRCIV